MFTQRAINAFTKSLDSHNLAQLKRQTSSRFEEQALRLPESAQDFKLLKLPAGKIKVASIEEVGSNKRIVKVEVDGSKAPLEYHLAREPRSGRWVVDDVLITQKSGAKGKEVTKSVIEQMDLLLSVRELFTEWQTKDRSRILAVSTPELASELDGLPPAWLDLVTLRVAGDGPLRSFHPEVLMKDEKAVVKLARGGNHILLDFHRQDGRWMLSDASISEGKANDVRSVRTLCAGLSQTRKFLELYAAADNQALAEVATESFQSNCLAEADLHLYPLPTLELLTKPFEVRNQGERLDVLLEHEETTYTVSVIYPEAKEDQKHNATEGGLSPRVEELTIYARKDEQVKRLSAVYRSQAVVEFYGEVLATGDASRLKHLSSADFNNTVWKRYPQEILQRIQLPEIEPVKPHVLNTVFQGPVTEVTVMQGTRALTYILHSEGGRLVVDDVLMPVVNRPNSLKKHIQLLAPLQILAEGLRRQDRQMLTDSSGHGLDRIIWTQVRDIPDIGFDIPRYFSLPVVAMRPGDTQAYLTLSDGVHVAEVEFEEDHGRFVVADAKFIDGPEHKPVAMLQAMRRQNATEMQSRYIRDVLPAGHEEHASAESLVQPL